MASSGKAMVETSLGKAGVGEEWNRKQKGFCSISYAMSIWDTLSILGFCMYLGWLKTNGLVEAREMENFVRHIVTEKSVYLDSLLLLLN